jgi:DNA-binding NtrC family response regulator
VLAKAEHPRLVAVIEHEPTSAEALAMVLRDWGAEVAVGADPGEIANQLGPRVAEIGWIITGYNLGDGANGIARVDQMASAAPDARVLVLSGEINRDTAAAAAKAGFEVMDKPARPDKIVAWLERA